MARDQREGVWDTLVVFSTTWKGLEQHTHLVTLSVFSADVLSHQLEFLFVGPSSSLAGSLLPLTAVMAACRPRYSGFLGHYCLFPFQ